MLSKLVQAKTGQFSFFIPSATKNVLKQITAECERQSKYQVKTRKSWTHTFHAFQSVRIQRLVILQQWNWKDLAQAWRSIDFCSKSLHFVVHFVHDLFVFRFVSSSVSTRWFSKARRSSWMLWPFSWSQLIALENDMIWYDMIRYDMIRYAMIWYDTIRYDMIWYDMIW